MASVSRAGEIGDYFRGDVGDFAEALSSAMEEEQFVANRLAGLRVEDVMSPPTFKPPTASMCSCAESTVLVVSTILPVMFSAPVPPFPT